MTKIACIIVICLSISACSFEGSFQSLFGYYHKTQEIDPTLIQKAANPICGLPKAAKPTVYSINGKQLKACIEHDEKAMLYIWRPNCSSSACISPNAIQTFCNDNQIELYIVAEYYDQPKMAIEYPTERPIFGIDCPYYSTNLTSKYLSLFFKDLGVSKQETKYKSFFFFQNGCLTSAADRVENITWMK